jgi:predicted ATP-grasp superfamily ATP-dependent carboligase
MATAGGKKKLPAKVSVSRSDFPIPPLPVAVAPVRQSLGEDIVGWVAACVLIALLLPMLGMLYLDVLEAKHDAKVQMEKVEKLRRQIEAQQRKDKEK